MATKNVIEVKDLPEEVLKRDSSLELSFSYSQKSLPEIVSEIEKKLILEALREENFVKTRAAKRLGISERVLRYKMKIYGIEDGKGDY